MNKFVLVGAVVFLGAAINVADAAQRSTRGRAAVRNPIHNMEFPHVSERQRALSVLEGNWVITGRTYRGCPYGEGTFTAREHNEFMEGGQFLVSRTQYSELFRNSNQIAFFGVDPQTGAYTYSMYSNLGISVQASGATRVRAGASLVGNPIRWRQTSVNVNMHGTQPAMVYTTEVISPNEYRFSFSSGGILWYDGVARREEQVINPAR